MKKRFIQLLKFTAFMSLISSVILLFKQNGWITTLFLSTSIQLAIGSLILGGWLLYIKRNRSAIYSLSAALLFSTQFMGYLFSSEEDLSSTEFETISSNISVAQFNVLKGNDSKNKTIKSIKKLNADVVSIQETGQKWTQLIQQELSKEYPYAVYFPTEVCCYGITLLSKQPLLNGEVTFHGGFPNIEADIEVNGQLAHIISSHTPSPVSRKNLIARNEQIEELSNHIAQIDSPTIVIGDFNTVPWDKNLEAFQENTKLKDSRKSYNSTFPSALGGIGIPIDYIFHSQNIICKNFSTISIEGSDHRGIIGEYAIN